MGYRIIIVEDEPNTRRGIREILDGAGYDVVAEATDGMDAVVMCRTHKPDLVLMDINMPLLDGLKASRIIRSEKTAGGILLVTTNVGKECVDLAKEVGVIGYVVKPVKEASLLPMVEIAVARAAEINSLESDVEKARGQLEARKLVERAKGLLMKKYDISEEVAYNRLRKLSMDKRCSMKEISKVIVINDEG
ncbi:Fis family transcriptional regulator [Desulfoluna limicola]|uniref:Fis family transcriptional regulator n=1 Tax=Desulfoluna limicola TaxID=2810562 RepID=A0ABN6F179_9BACT|nr:response regulator [Desulfoluna limicola]BCS95548.1 Fis family transcriptional regulator [Desulfoluna limicola]